MTYTIDSTLGTSFDESKQRFPALQPTTYQPSLDSTIHFCLGESSVDLLADNIKDFWKSQPKETYFTNDSEVQTSYIIPNGLQWVFLGFPKAFMRNKADKRDIRPFQSGFKLKENGFESVTKLFLAAITNEKPILDNDGNIQVFTLLLNSSKTKLIEGYKQPADYRSLKKLNTWLVKKFNLAPNQLWLHLASVPFSAKPEKFSNGEASSIGVMYQIDGLPTVLPPDTQKQLSALASSDIIKALLNDPFVVFDTTKALLNPDDTEQIIPDESSHEQPSSWDDDIAF